jgi:hypothetical protein
MKLEKYIYEAVADRCRYGRSTVTPDEALDIYQRDGMIVKEADWMQMDSVIRMKGLCFWDVPQEWSLGELLHNVSVALRNNIKCMLWE